MVHKYQSEKGMIVTRCNNGWILQVARNANNDMMAQLAPAMREAVSSRNLDPMLSGGGDEQPIIIPRFPHPMQIIEVDTYVFMKFADMMSFIGLSVEDLENEK